MKKFIVLLLSFVLYFNLISTAYASTVGGWSLGNPVVQGASVLYNGLKNVMINGKNVVKTSTALVTPTATQVAKLLAKGGGAYALSFAVEQLLGKVDWVLDPANNQIRYKAKKEGSITYSSPAIPQKFNTAQDYCNARLNLLKTSGGYPNASLRDIKINGATSGTCWIYTYSTTSVIDFNFNINDTNQTEEKVLPLPTVAAQVISNAESGNSDAKVAVASTAQDIVNDAENDSTKAKPIVDQLEANATTQTDADAGTANGQTKPNTETGGTDLSIEFPAFCGWAPLVCEAAQIAISFPQTLTQWWEVSKQKSEDWARSISEAYTEAKEYFTKDREDPDDELDIESPNTENIDTDISFGGACPADKTATINMGIGSINMDFTYTHICTIASDIRGLVIFCGFFIASLIIGGIKQ